jgi:hypothetical protein
MSMHSVMGFVIFEVTLRSAAEPMRFIVWPSRTR